MRAHGTVLKAVEDQFYGDRMGTIRILLATSGFSEPIRRTLRRSKSSALRQCSAPDNARDRSSKPLRCVAPHSDVPRARRLVTQDSAMDAKTLLRNGRRPAAQRFSGRAPRSVARKAFL